MDFALNNLQRLICHKKPNQPTNQPTNQVSNQKEFWKLFAYTVRIQTTILKVSVCKLLLISKNNR